MSKHLFSSKPAPDPPILDWLKWSGQDLEHYIAEDKVAAIIRVNKMGGIKTIYSPIIIHNAFASGSLAIIGNHRDKHTNPSFIYTDVSDIDSAMVVCTYDNIHLELRPKEHLSPRTISDTC